MNPAPFIEKIRTLLVGLPDLHIQEPSSKPGTLGTSAATELRVRFKGSLIRLYVVVRAIGAPSALRAGIETLKKISVVRGSPETYGILAVPYVSDAGINLCKKEGIGCIDIVGNCYIRFGSVHVEIRGNLNPAPSSTNPALFSPKSSRISRVLLAEPRRKWQVQELARESSVSIGLASRIKDELVRDNILMEENRLVRLTDPLSLLQKWSSHYAFRKNKRNEYYSLEAASTLESQIQSWCSKRGIRSALGVFSGVARVAPRVRIEKAFIYVDHSFEALEAAFDLKSGVYGSNLVLLRPYDEGVFIGAHQVGQDIVVSDIQLYLDIKSFKGRGSEAADSLLHSRIEQTWSTN